MTRRSLLFCLLALCPLWLSGAEVPPALAKALDRFRSEGAKGWAFTQTTVAGKKSLIEHFDPSKPEFSRWTLVSKDGAPPSADDLKDYNEKSTRRPADGNAPNVKDQLDRDSCELVQEDAEHSVYRFGLKAVDKDDKSAAFMAATFTLHKPTGAIERVELGSIQPFSPVFMVKVDEARTIMNYSLPSGDTPTLLQQVTVHIRGRAMWVRSLDEDMTVTYSDYHYAGKK